MFPTTSGKRNQGRRRGFTFIELTVVMAIIAILLTIALPRYFDGLQRGKEVALRENLNAMREAIGHYVGDKGTYPPSLETLVDLRYLRAIPEDPLTGSRDSWVITPPPDSTLGVYDLHSGSEGTARDGSLYATW